MDEMNPNAVPAEGTEATEETAAPEATEESAE